MLGGAAMKGLSAGMLLLLTKRCGVLLLVLLTTSLAYKLETHTTTKPVAAVIAVHPPKFPLLLDFMEQFKNCQSARSVMDVMPVFSNVEDERLFLSKWVTDKNQTADAAIWKPITMTTGFGQGQNPRSWKKLYGVARLLDEPSVDPHGTQYSFALMIDAEIGINNCNAFASFENALSAKFAAKKWFGDRTAGLPPHQQNAASAVARNEQEMAELRKASGEFAVYTWWNDVPWVEMASAKDMFRDWSEMTGQLVQLQMDDGPIRATQILEKLADTLFANEMTDNDQAFTAAADPAKNEAVANHLGHGPTPVTTAGSAFEHLIYQEYMVLRKGFVIEDLTDQLTQHSGFSMGERYCSLHANDKVLYQQRVQPLWSTKCPAGGTPPSSLFWFHLDRR